MDRKGRMLRRLANGDKTQFIITEDDERRLLREANTIVLCGEIEDCSAQEFIEDFYLIMNKSNNPITVLIASDGGNVEQGLACIRAIRKAQEKGIKIIGSVHGSAMSMAFFILQACDVRKMGQLDILMAHGITSFTHGDIRNLNAEQKLMKFWQEKIATLLANRCKNDYSKIEFWTAILSDNKPNYYTSSEALEMGLIDEVAQH